MADPDLDRRELSSSGRAAHTDSGGDGPPVVLYAARGLFAPQRAAFADRYRVIAWETGLAEETGDPWLRAYDLLGLLDAVGIERAVLAGAAAGGAVVLRAALLAPDRVRGLVLVDAWLGQPDAATVRERLPEIDAPALVVHSTADGAQADAHDLAAGLPDCRGRVAIDDEAATPTRTHPQRVTAVIREFLDGLPA
jgi:pimeloyl-ACP methyl ester carboxylesterase